MPQVTVYIRNEDMDKWKALEGKSQFIHEALRNQTPVLESSIQSDKQRRFQELKTEIGTAVRGEPQYTGLEEGA